jgi:hypothetical protein
VSYCHHGFLQFRYFHTVNNLFTCLVQDGYGKILLSEPDWKDTLPVQYHDFGGAPFDLFTSANGVKVKLAPPGTVNKVCSVARVDTIYGCGMQSSNP